MAQLKNYLTTYLCDDKFMKKLDKYTYKMAFQNGMLDLTNMDFKPLCQENYLTKTIPYNWELATTEDIAEVKIILKKITNWNDTHLDYYLSILGYAMTGDSGREQHFWYFRGETAENGKSIIFEILE
jgi:phage/plasmid-associated DNA primase